MITESMSDKLSSTSSIIFQYIKIDSQEVCSNRTLCNYLAGIFLVLTRTSKNTEREIWNPSFMNAVNLYGQRMFLSHF